MEEEKESDTHEDETHIAIFNGRAIRRRKWNRDKLSHFENACKSRKWGGDILSPVEIISWDREIILYQKIYKLAVYIYKL